MSRDIWVISDTHIGHYNFLKFTDDEGSLVRPFNSVDEMDECILDSWNSQVKEGDIVYHLGDVCICSQAKFKSLWPKFNGSKRLIVGNHDNIKFLSSGGFFKKVTMWRVFPEYGLIFSHVPMHEDNTKGLFNVHGHTHHRGSPEGRYFNVCCEPLGYKPIHIEDLAFVARNLK